MENVFESEKKRTRGRLVIRNVIIMFWWNMLLV